MKNQTKYYIIAGEASGDVHGANLIRAIQQLDANAIFRAWGGDQIQATGATLVKHYRSTAFMGFVEVLKNIKKIKSLFDVCKTDLKQWQPDILILIDYPGFNLRMAKFAKAIGIPKVVYYISPQVWAWKANRVHHIKKYVDNMLVILPFEKAFYRKYHYEVDFVGHPLLDVATQALAENFLSYKKQIIALLPGSRKQEIAKMLPVMIQVAQRFPEFQFVIAGLSVNGLTYYQSFIKQFPVEIILNNTSALLQKAKAAIVTSGTATLETALHQVPQIVCYSGNPLSYQIGKRLIKINYISLVNLIMDEPVVCELIQDDFNIERLTHELHLITKHQAYFKSMKNKYNKLVDRLGGKGASKRAAEIIVNKVPKF